ncbi:MAG: zf-HC2 domain-containing protein [Bryobacteraceae bacterium]|nr:zf-HC2 domain-containing protein [Bryobacteraceae bacterium]
MLTCADFELLLCDHIDGTLSAETRQRVESHIAQCPACAALAEDCAGVVNFIGRVEQVAPPPAAITRILQQIPVRQPAAGRARGALAGLLGQWLSPVLQPRMVMGMAMTILSFAMLGRFAGIEARQIRPADLQPARVIEATEDRLHRLWVGAVKYYDNLRLVYEIQLRLREMTDGEEQETEPAPDSAGQNPKGGKKQ